MGKDSRYKPVAIRSPRGARTTEVDWADGHHAVYPHAILRGYCPCAGCQGHSGDIRFVETADDKQELEEIETIGGYAVSFKWFDGHASGIYRYDFLRGLCQCEACRRTDPSEMPRT
ncbi:MAG: DUF971 domain-containing protein [Myxococcota bacterium]|nr:DUF971 domain-containing protein [Myxococcota bacterium]